MFNKFLKTFFYTSLIVAAIIGVLTVFSATSDWFADMLAGIASALHEEIPTLIVIFFPIATAVLCGLLALIVSISIHFITKKKTPAPAKKSKFFLYYFISLLGVSLLVILFCILGSNRFSLSELYVDKDNVFAIALLNGACILESIVIAAFLVSIFTLWKTNRLVAYIIGAITLLIIPSNYISRLAVHEISNHYYGYNDSYYSYDTSVAVQDYSEKEVYEPIEVEEDYLSFLWGDNDNISSALAYLFKERLSEWDSDYPQHFLSDIDWKVDELRSNDEEDWGYSLSDSEKQSETTIRKVYSYLTKHPSEILSAFYSYQNIIYQYMPIYEFYDTGAEALLKQLSAAHDDLYSDGDLDRLQKIYKLMINIEHGDAYEYYDDIKLHINDSYLPIFHDKDGDLYQGGVVWAYSFWARRHAEKTDDIAYTILTHLNEYYSDAAYYTEDEEEYDGEDDNDEDYYYEDEEAN